MKANDCIIATAYHESDIFSELNFHKFYNNENHDVLHYKGLFKNYHSKKSPYPVFLANPELWCNLHVSRLLVGHDEEQVLIRSLVRIIRSQPIH